MTKFGTKFGTKFISKLTAELLKKFMKKFMKKFTTKFVTQLVTVYGIKSGVRSGIVLMNSVRHVIVGRCVVRVSNQVDSRASSQATYLAAAHLRYRIDDQIWWGAVNQVCIYLADLAEGKQ